MTLSEIMDMTPQDRVNLLDQMMAIRYGGTGTKACKMLQAEIGHHHSAPYRWRAAPETMPGHVLLLLILLEQKEPKPLPDPFLAAADSLAATADQIERIAAGLRSIADLARGHSHFNSAV